MYSISRSTTQFGSVLFRTSSHSNTSFGRSPAYRRLASQLSSSSLLQSSSRAQTVANCHPSLLLSGFLPQSLRGAASRSFQISHRHHLKDYSKPGPAATSTAENETKDNEAATAGPEAKADATDSSSAKQSEETVDQKESKTEEEGKGEEEGKSKDEKKEDLPPPPPHGDKTPWQVFTETMSTEFQKSKEWNESTKQIGAAAHQFSESDSVRRTREAFEKSTGAVSSTASHAVKTTASAIGKGAAWTWETPVVKGVRIAANATGNAMDKATKPIRDTEAYKNVKNVIDDGSSSRYGGWTEKEERKRKRELQEAQRGNQQVMEEDLK